MTRCHGESGAGCVGEHRCLTHGLWHALGDHIRDFLSDVRLEDVISGSRGSTGGRLDASHRWIGTAQ